MSLPRQRRRSCGITALQIRGILQHRKPWQHLNAGLLRDLELVDVHDGGATGGLEAQPLAGGALLVALQPLLQEGLPQERRLQLCRQKGLHIGSSPTQAEDSWMSKLAENELAPEVAESVHFSGWVKDGRGLGLLGGIPAAAARVPQHGRHSARPCYRTLQDRNQRRGLGRTSAAAAAASAAAWHQALTRACRTRRQGLRNTAWVPQRPGKTAGPNGMPSGAGGLDKQWISALSGASRTGRQRDVQISVGCLYSKTAE